MHIVLCKEARKRVISLKVDIGLVKSMAVNSEHAYTGLMYNMCDAFGLGGITKGCLSHKNSFHKARTQN